MSSEVQTNAPETHETTVHIPTIQGENVPGLSIGGFAISNTILSMWIFMILLFIAIGFLYTALKTGAFPRLRSMGIDLIKRIDDFFFDALENKKSARTFLPLIGGFFIYIFLSNVFGL